MKTNYPTIREFTKRNIERMIQFYKTYKDDEIATPLVTQLSWSNNLLICLITREIIKILTNELKHSIIFHS